MLTRAGRGPRPWRRAVCWSLDKLYDLSVPLSVAACEMGATQGAAVGAGQGGTCRVLRHASTKCSLDAGLPL